MPIVIQDKIKTCKNSDEKLYIHHKNMFSYFMHRKAKLKDETVQNTYTIN